MSETIVCAGCHKDLSNSPMMTTLAEPGLRFCGSYCVGRWDERQSLVKQAVQQPALDDDNAKALAGAMAVKFAIFSDMMLYNFERFMHASLKRHEEEAERKDDPIKAALLAACESTLALLDWTASVGLHGLDGIKCGCATCGQRQILRDAIAEAKGVRS